MFCRTQAGCALLILLTACGAPRDPLRTLDRVRGHILTVGASEDPPFVIRRGDDATGIEADLARGFARRHGAGVRWVWGSQERHFAALAEGQLDLVIGGVTPKTPWAKNAAMTRPILDVHEVVATRGAVPIPAQLDDVEVAVEEGDAIGAAIEREGGNVHRVPRFDGSDHMIAASRSRALQLGYTPGRTLKTEQRAFAAPPGENAFLAELERYLAASHANVVRAAGKVE